MVRLHECAAVGTVPATDHEAAVPEAADAAVVEAQRALLRAEKRSVSGGEWYCVCMLRARTIVRTWTTPSITRRRAGPKPCSTASGSSFGTRAVLRMSLVDGEEAMVAAYSVCARRAACTEVRPRCESLLLREVTSIAMQARRDQAAGRRAVTDSVLWVLLSIMPYCQSLVKGSTACSLMSRAGVPDQHATLHVAEEASSATFDAHARLTECRSELQTEQLFGVAEMDGSDANNYIIKPSATVHLQRQSDAGGLTSSNLLRRAACACACVPRADRLVPPLGTLLFSALFSYYPRLRPTRTCARSLLGGGRRCRLLVGGDGAGECDGRALEYNVKPAFLRGLSGLLEAPAGGGQAGAAENVSAIGFSSHSCCAASVPEAIAPTQHAWRDASCV